MQKKSRKTPLAVASAPATADTQEELTPLREPAQLISDADEQAPAPPTTCMERLMVHTLPATPCHEEISVRLLLKPTSEAYQLAGTLWNEPGTDPWQLWFAFKASVAFLANSVIFGVLILWRQAAGSACVRKQASVGGDV